LTISINGAGWPEDAEFNNREITMRILAFCCVFAVVIGSAAQAGELSEKLKAHMVGLAKSENFSGAALVMKDGRPLLREAYGKANYELDVPNTVETKFRLGSITKQFTAMAVMILAEQGKLSVQDLIGKHLEDAPPAWANITIRHLLTHTSGIPSYTGFPQMMSRTVRLPASIDEIMATFRDKPLEFEPAEEFRYSNSGYIVLGKIIERASGQDYETFVRHSIFQPLGMNDSGYDHNAAILPNRAAGYVRTFIILANAPYIDMTWPHAAGALYSTIDDLAKWDRALAEGKLIGPKSYEEMFSPFLRTYAYGWFVRDRDGHREIGHGGGIHGFSTSIVRYPDDQVCVIVLNNVVPTGSERIARELAGMVLGLGAKGTDPK
jgi:CubicO group peptidase (beta-lactamase class C family)